ncbi:HTH DNA binding domain protein [uncultured archaeon]|nr:HTH DNA binding domain protein [uncultured archaeon]
MWYLKCKYKHSDCIYAPMLEKLNLSGFFHNIGYYFKGNYVYTSAILQLSGDEKSIKKYIQYIKTHAKVAKMEVYGNVIFVLARHKKELELYSAAYNPALIHPAPAYLSKDGFEIVEVASWDRKILADLIRSLKKNKTTTYLEVLKFVSKKMDDIYVSKLLPDLPQKQDEAVRLAFRNGYYLFPRKTNLDKLAKMANVSKPTFRENLRKAEAKLMPKLISE